MFWVALENENVRDKVIHQRSHRSRSPLRFWGSESGETKGIESTGITLNIYANYWLTVHLRLLGVGYFTPTSGTWAHPRCKNL